MKLSPLSKPGRMNPILSISSQFFAPSISLPSSSSSTPLFHGALSVRKFPPAGSTKNTPVFPSEENIIKSSLPSSALFPAPQAPKSSILAAVGDKTDTTSSTSRLLEAYKQRLSLKPNSEQINRAQVKSNNTLSGLAQSREKNSQLPELSPLQFGSLRKIKSRPSQNQNKRNTLISTSLSFKLNLAQEKDEESYKIGLTYGSKTERRGSILRQSSSSVVNEFKKISQEFKLDHQDEKEQRRSEIRSISESPVKRMSRILAKQSKQKYRMQKIKKKVQEIGRVSTKRWLRSHSPSPEHHHSPRHIFHAQEESQKPSQPIEEHKTKRAPAPKLSEDGLRQFTKELFETWEGVDNCDVYSGWLSVGNIREHMVGLGLTKDHHLLQFALTPHFRVRKSRTVLFQNELNAVRVTEDQFVGMVRGPQRVTKMIAVLDESAAHIESAIRKREEQAEREKEQQQFEDFAGMSSSGKLVSPKTGKIEPLKLLLARRNTLVSPPFASAFKRRKSIRRGSIDPGSFRQASVRL